MSRSKNERSVPMQRGRKQEMLVKRRSHKRIRRMPIETHSDELKRVGFREQLDRETKQR